MAGFGAYAATYLTIHIVTLIVTWWAIQTVKFDLFFKNPSGPRAKVLMILLTIAISYLVGEFFVNYLFRSLELPNF